MNHAPSTEKKASLLTFSSGGWVLLLSAFFCVVAAGIVLYPVYQTGFIRAVGDGHNPDTYGFNLANLTMERSMLVGGGVPKDGIRALPPSLIETITPAQVHLMNENEKRRGRFLVSTDLVIGVALNGEARAYPVRVLNFHEVFNDVLGDTPIAVTYSPLAGAAVVFDRRIDGAGAAPVEFGVSGLLVNSDLVMFDRRKTAADESLWPQLAMRAISGPAVGKALTVVPCELTTYKQWVDAHPDTRVLEGLRTLKAEYKKEPYNTYSASDELKFPVAPLPDRSRFPFKTRILATSTDGGAHWKVTLPTVESAATTLPANAIRIPSYYFAWYAQHPTDTDYSALLP